MEVGELAFLCFFFFQAEDGIRDKLVTGVQTCALPIYPGFPIYPSVVRFAGAVPVRYPLDAVGGVNAELLAPLIGPRTRALVVNLPGNPTGGIATTDALDAIAELALRHDLVVISDEVYGRIRYDRPADTIAALPGMLERTVIV